MLQIYNSNNHAIIVTPSSQMTTSLCTKNHKPAWSQNIVRSTCVEYEAHSTHVHRWLRYEANCGCCFAGTCGVNGRGGANLFGVLKLCYVDPQNGSDRSHHARPADWYSAANVLTVC